MSSYRFARRSFLAAVGGAVGLRAMLDNMVASAAGGSSPPRFLLTHWPVGTVKYLFKPSGSGSTYTASKVIQPFIDAGLREDMSVLYGLKIDFFAKRFGGGHESGTPMMTTGIDVPGTRANGGETDDGVAGGPSFDQIFLKNVPALREGPGGASYINAICDARVDSKETSTQCLSYGYTMRSVAAATGGSGGKVTEATPLLPQLSPLQLYLSTFSSVMPGGATDANQAELLRGVKMRKSVLDYSLRELDRIKTLAPGSESSKVESHATAIRDAEKVLQTQIDAGVINTASCALPTKPDAGLTGKKGADNADYRTDGQPSPAPSSDESTHELVGKTHMAIITAAFQCDLTRVATFQWSPGTNHVSFKGQYPGRPDQIYMHHPTSHLINNNSALGSSSPGGANGDILQFLANVQTWYNAKTADVLKSLKAAKDAFGNSVLDYTVVPYLTEVAETRHTRAPLPAFIFGGKALGMTHGSYYDFESAQRSHNDIWATVAQAYLGADPFSKLTAENFYKSGVKPIAGIWKAPT